MEIIKIESASLDLRIDKPGIYEMSKEQYHADPCILPSLSRSCIVKMLEKSPLHAANDHPRIKIAGVTPEDDEDEAPANPKEMTARIVGEQADFLLMGGADVYEVIPYDKYTTKEARAARDDVLARRKIPVKKKHRDRAEKMIEVFRKRFTLERFPELQEGFPTEGFQRVVIWHENGVWNRAMLDALGRHVWDYKSTAADAHPHNWIKSQLFGMGLEMQAAYYPRGYAAVTGERKFFIFAVQEQSDPCDCYPVIVDPVDLADANRRIVWAQGVWKNGLETGHWDGYVTRAVTACAPPWIRSRWEEFFEHEKTLAKIKKEESDPARLLAAG